MRGTSSDFGYGWTPGVNVQLSVSATNDVTLTINGQRRTFYCTPYLVGYQLPDGTFAPNLLGVNFSAYTPSDAVGVVTGRASGLHQYGVGGTREGRRSGLGQESVATPAKASGVCAFELPLRARVHRLKRLRKNKL